MSKELVSQEKLMEWSGTKTRPALERWLHENHIDFCVSAKNKIVTTVSVINAGILGAKVYRDLEYV